MAFDRQEYERLKALHQEKNTDLGASTIGMSPENI